MDLSYMALYRHHRSFGLRIHATLLLDQVKKIVIFTVVLLYSAFAKAQCAMCRAVIESDGSNAEAEGLNNGITYLMIFPYLLVGGIIYMIYRSTTRKKLN